MVNNAVKEYGYQGTVLLDPGAASVQAYRIGEIPMTFLVGQDGTVQTYQSGSTDERLGQATLFGQALARGRKVHSRLPANPW